MAEAEWASSDDPVRMLQFLRGHYSVSDRKQRLLSVAFCRRIWDLLTDERSQKAVEIAERFAEGEARPEELADAHTGAKQACAAALGLAGRWDDSAMAAGAAEYASYSGAAFVVSVSYRSSTLGDINREDLTLSRRLLTTELVREVFGNPYRFVSAEPHWLTETVVALASGIYAERAFDRMPILADALEETGCDNTDVLAHCRGDGSHVRGCWVVDLVLGKK